MLRVSDIHAIRDPERYLYTVASNLVKEYAVLDRWQARGVDLEGANVQQQLGELPAFDAQLDVAQRVARLRTVLAQLSPKCRAAVVLQYRHALTYEEIGERLGVSPHMVKKYLAQALAHCRRRMARME
jgi:RNA polymerase sigma-70 factor (ECF subfamily)